MLTCAPRGHFGLFSRVANEAARVQEVPGPNGARGDQTGSSMVRFCCQRGQRCDRRPVLWAVSPFASVHWLAACSSATVLLDAGKLRALVRSVHGGDINPAALCVLSTCLSETVGRCFLLVCDCIPAFLTREFVVFIQFSQGLPLAGYEHGYIWLPSKFCFVWVLPLTSRQLILFCIGRFL